MKKLNLGCGYDIRDGWINIDFIKNNGVDIVMDLTKIPYDFDTDSIDEIEMLGILEHLRNPKEIIDELWRICKTGGKIKIRTTHFSNFQSWGDITHVRTFTSFSLDHVKYGNKNKTLLKDKDTLFIIESKIIMGNIFRVIGIEKIINLCNTTRCIYERSFAQIFPAIGIEWNLIKTHSRNVEVSGDVSNSKHRSKE